MRWWGRAAEPNQLTSSSIVAIASLCTFSLDAYSPSSAKAIAIPSKASSTGWVAGLAIVIAARQTESTPVRENKKSI